VPVRQKSVVCTTYMQILKSGSFVLLQLAISSVSMSYSK